VLTLSIIENNVFSRKGGNSNLLYLTFGKSVLDIFLMHYTDLDYI